MLSEGVAGSSLNQSLRVVRVCLLVVFNKPSGESVVPIKCGNYFTIKFTVYIYTTPKAVYIWTETKNKRKTKEQRNYQIISFFKFQIERLILLGLFQLNFVPV